MIDLVQFTDTCGDPVWVNPALVRMVSPMFTGRTVLTFGDEGEEAELTVAEPYMVVLPLLTGKPWQVPGEVLQAALDYEAARTAAAKAERAKG